jgi:lipoprotein-anchoring transpeptidase ErfK/SrfK
MISLHLHIATQTLSVFAQHQLIKKYEVSTAKKGVGEKYGSEQTPRGWHIIRAKIGAGCVCNTVFVKRRPTGEIYTPALHAQFPERDWILTRILWLSGLELHKNKFGEVDTMKRKIYIHGTPDQTQMGIPGSRGCIRMRNVEMIELFDQVSAGTRLLIEE